MKKNITLFAILVLISFAQVTKASVLYSQSIILAPGWNIVSTPKILESHSFSLPENSNNFDIYALNASSTTGWSTLADLGQTEFTPLFGYFVNNKSTSTQTLTFNYEASTTPNQRLFERTFTKTGWYSFGISNGTYARKTTDSTLDKNNPSSILISANGGYDSVIDLTDGQTMNSVKVGDTWKQAVSSDINSLNDLTETKGYAIHITQPNTLYSGFQNNVDTPPVQQPLGASLVVTNDSASPASHVVQVSTATQTMNVPLAIFDIKSHNQASTLQGLIVGLSISSTTLPVGSLFSNIQLKVEGLTYSASTITATSAIFTNLSIPLNTDVNTPMTILATLTPDRNGFYDVTSVSTTLTPSLVSAIDETYNTVNSSSNTVLTSNTLSFSSSGITVGSVATNVGQAVSNTNGSSTKSFTFTYGLTAGNNPIYVSASSTNALTVNTTGAVGTITMVALRDSDSTSDGAGYFYIAPGQTKTFTAYFVSQGMAGSVAGTYGITGLNYGTDYTNGSIINPRSLNDPIIVNTLFANLSY